MNVQALLISGGQVSARRDTEVPDWISAKCPHRRATGHDTPGLLILAPIVWGMERVERVKLKKRRAVCGQFVEGEGEGEGEGEKKVYEYLVS